MPILNVNHVSKIYGTKQNLKHYTILTFQSIKENSLQWDLLVQVRQPLNVISSIDSISGGTVNQWQ